jgi:hypothetical protein
MAVSDQDGIKIPNQGSPIAQGMDARFTGIDKQMLSLQEQQGTGKEPISFRKARPCAEKGNRRHDVKELPKATEKRV